MFEKLLQSDPVELPSQIGLKPSSMTALSAGFNNTSDNRKSFLILENCSYLTPRTHTLVHKINSLALMKTHHSAHERMA